MVLIKNIYWPYEEKGGYKIPRDFAATLIFLPRAIIYYFLPTMQKIIRLYSKSCKNQRIHTGEKVWLTGENPFLANNAKNHSVILKVLQDINDFTREKNHCVTYWRKPFFLLTMRKIFRFVLKSFKISTNLHGRKSVTNWTKSFFLPTLRKIIRLDWKNYKTSMNSYRKKDTYISY